MVYSAPADGAGFIYNARGSKRDDGARTRTTRPADERNGGNPEDVGQLNASLMQRDAIPRDETTVPECPCDSLARRAVSIVGAHSEK